MKEKILITLSTGKTGFAVTVQLLEEGYPVRIYVRSRNEKAVALEKLGAEIAIGEFDNFEQLKTAMTGKDYFNKSKYRNRSISNWFAAFKKFNLIPFTKVPDKKEREAINR